ncbi:MAG: RNA polymerase sigma-54 factor [Rhodobacter sp.]|uniref:RNA polymerase factor sigma-54 n=1 Tax=Pararhodobacter sp. TaxID=2127056 RepID=UPI001D45215A|nr:RNA polymerase sigma-54 factor [Pararhodobacter sp.]MCB1344357.1 RNA polymerase sigma-54 factor [Paracoccaceae bacterium]MCC0072490.1 RNA polymerase sigma-54 factor [Rhodobacter sp.]HPD92635.1 RNA polymerase sigma-54 factor [Pararhodobacter sp.]
MALNPRLELRQEQRLALTPAVRVRLSVLRMSPTDLDEEIAREVARNPFLVVDAPRGGAQSLPLADDLAAPVQSFHEDLRRQLALMDLSSPVRAAALLLVGELGEDGLLGTDIDTLAAELAIDPAPLHAGLEALQRCDPVGVGARDVRDCLRLQLEDRGLDRAAALATLDLLAVFARRDWPAAARALGLTPAQARDRAAMLRNLSPRPIAPGLNDRAVTLRPDLRLVRHDDGTLSLLPDDGARPAVALDLAMVRRAEAEGFAAELLQRARALIAALDMRGQTLTRIGAWLVGRQAGFFTDGPGALAPVTQAALAADLGLHPSTVSRALSGKAVDVDGRLWPLSVFFSSALAGADGPVSARAVQRRVAELIAAEPSHRPHSDNALAKILREQGVDIARRTVTKYREGLRIPPSSTRRRLAAERRGE